MCFKTDALSIIGASKKITLHLLVLSTKVVFEVNSGADKSSTRRIQIVTNRFLDSNPVTFGNSGRIAKRHLAKIGKPSSETRIRETL
jgi:hypothetical protein